MQRSALRLGGIAASAIMLAAALGACESKQDLTNPDSGSTAATPKPANISEQESGPDSLIAYGMQVPQGATQLGPLAQIRSSRLIATYQPELDAKLKEKADKQAARDAQALAKGTTPPTTKPTPATRPSTDTFTPIGDDAPTADTTISLMRIDGNVSDVVHRMILQIAAVLPNADVDTKNLSTYCDSVEHRYTGCSLDVRGTTAGGRDIRVTMSVDPGNLTTRTAPPSAMTHPIMMLQVQYVGDPVKGQSGKDTDGIKDVPYGDAKAPASSVLWPKMDTDAPATTPLLGGLWTAPAVATILLASYHPAFAEVVTTKYKDADAIARDWAAARGTGGKYTVDTVEDLNEISTTYRAVRSDGAQASATYILSGRGSYAMLFWSPAPATSSTK